MCKNCSCPQLSYATYREAVLIIFHLNLKTNIVALLLYYIGLLEERGKGRTHCHNMTGETRWWWWWSNYSCVVCVQRSRWSSEWRRLRGSSSSSVYLSSFFSSCSSPSLSATTAAPSTKSSRKRSDTERREADSTRKIISVNTFEGLLLAVSALAGIFICNRGTLQNCEMVIGLLTFNCLLWVVWTDSRRLTNDCIVRLQNAINNWMIPTVQRSLNSAHPVHIVLVFVYFKQLIANKKLSPSWHFLRFRLH